MEFSATLNSRAKFPDESGVTVLRRIVLPVGSCTWIERTFASIFPASNPQYVLVVMLDEPKPSKDYVYEYKDDSGWKIKGTQFNTAGWTSVEVTGKIIEKIGPILATKY